MYVLKKKSHFFLSWTQLSAKHCYVLPVLSPFLTPNQVKIACLYSGHDILHLNRVEECHSIIKKISSPDDSEKPKTAVKQRKMKTLIFEEGTNTCCGPT